MEENLNVLNETQESVVDSQNTEQVETPESVSVDVTTTQEDKPIQDAETNAKFATQRRDNEQKAYVKAQDDLVARQYGSSHGIYTVADYDKAVNEQAQAEQNKAYEDAGLNQEMINKIINDNPTVQKANEIISKQAEDVRINADIKDLFDSFPEAKDSKIPDEVFLESISKGIPLKYAYSMFANKNSQAIAEQKTLRGLQQNAQTSPGALGSGQTAQTSSINNMSKADFHKMQNEVLMGERKQI